MAALYDVAKLNKNGTQRVELFEGGELWVIDDEKRAEIKLEASAAANLLAFMDQWAEKIHDSID